MKSVLFGALVVLAKHYPQTCCEKVDARPTYNDYTKNYFSWFIYKPFDWKSNILIILDK